MTIENKKPNFEFQIVNNDFKPTGEGKAVKEELVEIVHTLKQVLCVKG